MLVQVRLLKTKLGFFFLSVLVGSLCKRQLLINIYVSHIYLYKSSRVLVKHEFIRYLKLFLNNNRYVINEFITENHNRYVINEFITENHNRYVINEFITENHNHYVINEFITESEKP